MSAKSAKKEDSTVLTAILDQDALNTVANDPQNQKVQKKFDEAFNDLDFDNLDESGIPQSKDHVAVEAKAENKVAPVLEFDATGSESIDFEMESTKQTESFSSKPDSNPGMDLDFSDEGGLDLSNESMDSFEESTKKTEMLSIKGLDFGDLGGDIESEDEIGEIEMSKKPNAQQTKSVEDHDLPELTSQDLLNDIEKMGESSSGDLISTIEAKENIEATINDIIRPKNLEGTAELDLNQLAAESNADLDPDLFPKTDEKNLGELDIDFTDANQSLTGKNIHKLNASFDDMLISEAVVTENSEKSIGDFNFNEATSHDTHISNTLKASMTDANIEENRIQHAETMSQMAGTTRIHDEEYARMQATMRQLREERETLLGTIKSLKSQMMEYEQDNLTLKAILDETKIEVNILRKRNTAELEDFKYRLTMSDEKRILAEEKARHLEKIKEKFEQKARIDFNQIRQREKELESKLELMAMDVDSQVHSRDQKILELRRKIDSLEFNMENATIREQKSVDDKRKLEDKLNKIMKTLRNSIKNLEDDIEASTEDFDHNEKTK